jgi:hypothetical protein
MACKQKVLSLKLKTSNEAVEAFQNKSETKSIPKRSVLLKMMMNLKSMVLKNSMPELQLPKFDGSASKYTAFINSFDGTIL